MVQKQFGDKHPQIIIIFIFLFYNRNFLFPHRKKNNNRFFWLWAHRDLLKALKN